MTDTDQTRLDRTRADAADSAEMADGTAQEGLDLDVLPGGALAALEALLIIAEEPMTELRLASALALPVDRVETLVAELVADYDGADPTSGSGRPRGFELRRLAGGWRIYSRAEFHDVLAGYVLDGQSAKLSQAALETLAVVAYRQPVSRARISAIRGVSVDGVVRTLVSRGLIEEVGTAEESGANLYGTTGEFLERMGLESLDELPKLAPYLPDDMNEEF